MDLRPERQKKIGLRVIYLNPEINARMMACVAGHPSFNLQELDEESNS
jgi:hypothetical protein